MKMRYRCNQQVNDTMYGLESGAVLPGLAVVVPDVTYVTAILYKFAALHFEPQADLK